MKMKFAKPWWTSDPTTEALAILAIVVVIGAVLAIIIDQIRIRRHGKRRK